MEEKARKASEEAMILEESGSRTGANLVTLLRFSTFIVSKAKRVVITQAARRPVKDKPLSTHSKYSLHLLTYVSNQKVFV